MLSDIETLSSQLVKSGVKKQFFFFAKYLRLKLIYSMDEKKISFLNQYGFNDEYDHLDINEIYLYTEKTVVFITSTGRIYTYDYTINYLHLTSNGPLIKMQDIDLILNKFPSAIISNSRYGEFLQCIETVLFKVETIYIFDLAALCRQKKITRIIAIVILLMQLHEKNKTPTLIKVFDRILFGK